MNEILYWAEHLKRKWLEASAEEGTVLHASDITKCPGGCQEPSLAGGGQEPYLQGGAVCVPLVRLLSFPSVQTLCGSLQRLQHALQGDPRVKLTGDALAVVVAIGEDVEADIDEEWGDPACAETLQSAVDCMEDWDAEL